jgi:hypothetical protein
MKTLTVYGASDDLIEADGIPGADEFGNGSNNIYRGYLHVKAGDHEIAIHCIYFGHWCFGVGTLSGNDYDDFPDWPIRRGWGGRGYSEVLEIDLPDDARLEYVDKER